MMYVTTIDIPNHTATEYRALLDKMGVEKRPEANIFLHLTVEMEKGFRVIEIWDDKEAFENFLKNRLVPAAKALGIDHKADISVLPLYNFFGPRLGELPMLIPTLPGAPKNDSTR